MPKLLGALCVFLPSALASYPVSKPGNPAGTGRQVEDVKIPADVLACSNPAYAIGGDGYWSYEQIAKAFYEFSVLPWNWASRSAADHVGDCVAALVIVAGECNPGSDPAKGCDARSTGPSGVFQTDFLRTGGPGAKVNPVLGGGPMSLCISAYGAGFMAAPFYTATAGQVATLEGDSYFTCGGSFASVSEYHCDDPGSAGGKTYSNFIGPFCHKARDSRWSPCSGGGAGSCCAMWNGGGNAGQPAFPDYYYEKADEAQGSRFETICSAAAESFSEIKV